MHARAFLRCVHGADSRRNGLLEDPLGDCGCRAGLPALCVRAVFTVGFSTGWLAVDQGPF